MDCICSTTTSRCRSRVHNCICLMVDNRKCISEKHICCCKKYDHVKCYSIKHMCSCRKYNHVKCSSTNHQCVCDIDSERCKFHSVNSVSFSSMSI